MSHLVGKVALVTGASRGIGRAIAERLGRDGVNVAITYAANREQAAAVVETIKANGVEAIAVQSDISNIESTRTLFQQVLNTFGQLDIVVNNVGVSVFKPTIDMTESDFDRVFNTNAKGTFFALQEAAKHIGNGGRIISLSSDGTQQSIPAGGLYTGSKAAIEQASCGQRQGIKSSFPIHGMKKNCVSLRQQPEQQQKQERFKKQRHKK